MLPNVLQTLGTDNMPNTKCFPQNICDDIIRSKVKSFRTLVRPLLTFDKQNNLFCRCNQYANIDAKESFNLNLLVFQYAEIMPQFEQLRTHLIFIQIHIVVY